MTTPAIVVTFGPNGQPFELDRLNENFAILVAAINALAADTVLQLGAVPGNDSMYLPITGGTLLGALAAPAVLVGPVAGPQYPAVTTGDAATEAVRGAVLKAAASADGASSAVNVTSPDAATQTGAYVQVDVQSIATLCNELKGDLTQLITDFNALVTNLNDLKTKLRAAGTMAT